MTIPYQVLKSKIVTIADLDGVEKQFKIHRVPAVLGREIFTQYPITAIPKVGNYEANENLMLQLIQYAQVESEGSWVALENRVLIDSHISCWEMLIKLEKELVQYNTGFLAKGNLSTALKSLLTQVLTSIKSSET